MHRLEKLSFNNKGINIYIYNKNGEFVSRKAFVHIDTLKKHIAQVPDDCVWKLVLECSTAGDSRFSAFGAKVKVFKKEDYIEFFYQLSKRFNGETNLVIEDPWYRKIEYVRSIKGKEPDYMVLGKTKYDAKFLTQWYHLLWIRYLDENPELVEYLKLFDDYNDIFKGKAIACQADSIRKYIKDGRDSLLAECEELNNKFKVPMK